ncbi:hypothetical protein LVS37_23420, partial [Klebsiella pneumoniae]|nr:hypothetical protein [Klebsiella pneumoniae]
MALARNTVFEETTEIGFNSRTKKVKKPNKLKPLQIIKLYEPSAPLTPWICPYISRHLLSLNPLLARCRRYSRG